MVAPTVVLVFGVSCPEPCGISAPELASIENAVVTVMSQKGFTVKPADPKEPRPTGESASVELRDEAGLREVDRIVALDLEPPLEARRTLWITHFLRGTAGPWSVSRIACKKGEGGAFECPNVRGSTMAGLRPRQAEDVDMVAALRANARRVEKCVRAEDAVPVAERVFGKVEMDLEVKNDGRVRVVAIAPAVAARSKFGACLLKAMQAIDVGPFEGRPIELTVPLDL